MQWAEVVLKFISRFPDLSALIDMIRTQIGQNSSRSMTRVKRIYRIFYYRKVLSATAVTDTTTQRAIVQRMTCSIPRS